jgi:hypothetical protein
LIDPKQIVLFRPKMCGTAKRNLYERIGARFAKITTSRHELESLHCDFIPAVGCTPALRPLIEVWRIQKRPFLYWDRGYLRRIFTAWLPKGKDGGYYRWHLNCFQMPRVREVPDDRLKALKIPVSPWKRGGDRVVIAPSLPDYDQLHGCEGWIGETKARLKELTKRPVFVRHRDSDVPLDEELKDAHCLVTHGSNAANESVVMGCPVFVLGDCAARHVGLTDLGRIESPVYPDRTAWLKSLAYSQYTEAEIVSGEIWRHVGA